MDSRFFLNDPVPTALFFQGGGALGSFGAGVACATVNNPSVKLVMAGGTSSGAVTARALVNGYIEGSRQGDAADYASANVKQVWQEMVNFQQLKLPMWYSAANMYFSFLPSGVRQAFQESAMATLSSNKTTAPLLEFYEYLDAKGLDLAPSTKKGDPHLFVNATLHDGERNLWRSQPEHEVVFSLNGMSAKEQHRCVAASGCLDFSLPVKIGNREYYDGAYSSALPNPMGMAEICARKDYAMVIVRTRPTAAFDFESSMNQTDWMRAYFNKKLDASTEMIRDAFPRLRLSVIEPDQAEKNSSDILNHEMRFNSHTVNERFQNGQKIAARSLERDLGIVSVPPTRKSTSSAQPSRARALSEANFL